MPTVAALLAFCTAVLVLVNQIRQGRQQAIKIQEIHVLVNSQLTRVVERVDQLKKVLEDKDIEIPPMKRDYS